MLWRKKSNKMETAVPFFPFCHILITLQWWRRSALSATSSSEHSLHHLWHTVHCGTGPKDFCFPRACAPAGCAMTLRSTSDKTTIKQEKTEPQCIFQVSTHSTKDLQNLKLYAQLKISAAPKMLHDFKWNLPHAQQGINNAFRQMHSRCFQRWDNKISKHCCHNLPFQIRTLIALFS